MFLVDVYTCWNLTGLPVMYLLEIHILECLWNVPSTTTKGETLTRWTPRLLKVKPAPTVSEIKVFALNPNSN